MSYSPPFSHSPPREPLEGTPHLTRASESSNISELESLSPSPGNAIPPSPHRSIRAEQSISIAPTSLSAPFLAPRPSPEGEGHHVSPLTEGSSGQNNARQRVSFEGNPASASTPSHSPRTHVHVHPLLHETVYQTPRGIDSTMTKMSHSSDPPRSPSIVHSTGAANSQKKPAHESPAAASSPRSRTTSPMRRIGWSPFHHTHEDFFVPVNPFRPRTRPRRLPFYNRDVESRIQFDPTCQENLLCCVTPLDCSPKDRFLSFLQDARYFILDTLPRQLYLHLLLRLPSLYFSRIARVYGDAQLSKPDLERMIDTYSSSSQLEQRRQIVNSSPIPPGVHYHPADILPFPDEWTTANVSPALVRFKQSWEYFIDSLLREWKTFNLVSALLHTAIITMFQIQEMANDPIIRTAALLSLTSALMSLSYGCMYIVRFGTMRSMYKATRWAEEAARTTPFILWNVWVLLAMPAVWLAWSMIFFIVAILAFVWRYGSSEDPVSPQLLSPTAAIGPRIAVSALFLLGLLYLAAIVKTLHNYGKATEIRLFERMIAGSGTSDIPEDDVREAERGRQRGRGTSYGRERERARGGHKREATEPAGLSAVTGLGLTGLDEVTGPRGSDEIFPREKQRHRKEASV